MSASVFKRETFIKHEKFMDVAFHVTHTIARDDHYVVHGAYVNQGMDKHWYCSDLCTIRIAKDKVHEWTETDMVPESVSLRKVSWRAIGA